MSTDTRHHIETALRAFSGADLRAASIGLLKSLGYKSEKTLNLDNTPDIFLAEFDKRDREFRKGKALFERWKSVEILFQITDDEVRNVWAQGRPSVDNFGRKRSKNGRSPAKPVNNIKMIAGEPKTDDNVK